MAGGGYEVSCGCYTPRTLTQGCLDRSFDVSLKTRSSVPCLDNSTTLFRLILI